MSIWNKTSVSKADVEQLQKRYGVDALTASIMTRRGLTNGNDILYFIEDDLRFQNSPFLFSSMEDAVDRILSAQEEKEKVLIFGDRDVDGVSATTVLFDCLSSMGIDVSYRLPIGDDAYGLSMVAVDDFAKENGNLIITVDCGISNTQEISHAGELGIDVIVLDHHNPPSNLPAPAIIVDPKLQDSGYPFADISGCAVVYKVVNAIRFSKSEWYKQELALLNITEDSTKGKTDYVIECIKLRNLIPTGRITETIHEAPIDIFDTKLFSYLKGQAILVWDEGNIKNLLKDIFGSKAEFNIMDMRPKIASIMPSTAALPLSHLMNISKIAKYGNHPPTEMGAFYNILVSYINETIRKAHPQDAAQEEQDLQLVALAALADIMPMKNENRLFVKQALSSINKARIRPGLMELMSVVNMLGKKVTSTDLSWTIVSNLNAAGRLGHPELAAELFLQKDPALREQTALKIVELNNERKQLSQDALAYSAIQAESSLSAYSHKLCLVIDERINRGVCGILAGRLMSKYDIPTIVVTFVEDNAVGSMRSCRGVKATEFLDKFGSFFINHGGHNAAAGFSFERDKLKEFESLVKKYSDDIQLEASKSDIIDIDAEIPHTYLTPNLLDLTDKFEPFGEANKPLLFMTKKIKILEGHCLGKGEKTHLKLLVDGGAYKWPALFWNEGERLNRDFCVGDYVDLLFHVERNVFNGAEIPQIILSDIKKSL